jgi:hypothetical protein
MVVKKKNIRWRTAKILRYALKRFLLWLSYADHMGWKMMLN